MTLIQQKHETGLVAYRCPQFPTTVAHGFSTRLGGVSTAPLDSLNLITPRGDTQENVMENYRRFHEAQGVTTSLFVRNSQVHGDVVRPVTTHHGLTLDQLTLPTATFPPADGLITNHTGLALWVYNGDCVPLLFCDPVKKAIGVAHAGWRGTALGIAKKTIEAMVTHYGCDPGDILVALGPSIRACCFSCHSDVPQAMTQNLGEKAQPFIAPQGEGKFAVDLQGINRLWLEEAGVTQIFSDPPCTGCHPEEFWSHRFMGDARGTMGAVICMED